ANKKCELQRLAKFLKTGLNAKPLETRLKEVEIDQSHPHVDLHPNRCVLCGRCIFVCAQHRGDSVLTFAKRGLDTLVSAYGAGDAGDAGDAGSTDCPECMACVEICPVGAITPRAASPSG
ncbi:MAG: 4Fe-4S dicluster domain-containing protein, partial [Desulfobacterales bacterium]|nr:4Fe-4S dicluster domain-containing protein [Desulfobacterales bacterium]